MNLYKYLFFYYLIIINIIGFGFFLKKFFIFSKTENDLGYYGIYGLFLLTFLSYFTSFFLSHSQFFNLLFLIVGIIFFIYFIKSKILIFKKDIFYLILISTLFILFIVGAKNHDDFPYYHFSYTHLLTQEYSFKGLGNFNHGFRTHSSIFYLGSLFYYPSTDFFLIHLSPSFFMIFVNLIFINKILKLYTNQEKKDVLVFSLLAIAFINIFFYRMAEHGTDRSAQILILLLITILLESFLIKFKNINKFENEITNFFIILTLCITLKPLYLIYSLFFLIIFTNCVYKKNLIQFLLQRKYIYICIIFLFFYFYTNFNNTGCILYPVSLTCFDSFSWSIPIEEVNSMNLWYEQWSKAGAAPNFRIDNPDIYIQKLNWLSNWINLYFFNKVLDLILSLFFLLIIFYLVFKNYNSNISSKIKKNYFYLFFLLIILFCEWFFKHPALRYGGYHLFAILFFLVFIFFLQEKIVLNKSKIFTWFTLILTIFVVRNSLRINKEVTQYQLNINNVSYNKVFKNKNIFKRINYLMNCKLYKVDCSKDNLSYEKRIFYRKNKI
jgi:hypothetical protein